MSSLQAHTSGREAALARSFARRMAPVAAMVGLLVAVAPPLVTELVGQHRLRALVAQEAQDVADTLGDLATRQPYFWRYTARKLIGAGLPDRSVVGELRVTGCDGETLLSPADLGVDEAGEGAVAWAAVWARDRVVAWVRAAGAVTPVHDAALAIGVGSGLAGLALGVLLWLVPTGVVRRQARDLDATVARLAAAEVALVDANRGLATRVEEAVREVRTLSERVVSIQEEERGRIARDLHDSVGQLLTALQIDLQLASGSREDARDRRLQAALSLAERSLGELRRVVRDLRPLELEGGGLAEALRATAERFEVRTGVVTSLRHEGPDVDDEAAAVCLLRVAQEALANVSRHAAASEVGILLRVGDGVARLEVTDDGRGFVPGSVRAGPASCDVASGSGLAGMRERARFIGGEVTVTSAPGKGTVVSIEVPAAGG